MSKFFRQMIDKSRRISRDDFAVNLGNIPGDISEMLDNERVKSITTKARGNMETSPPLPNGAPRLQTAQFGDIENAPELIRGEVAAVDGRPVLPAQRYSIGQALCVGVGSVSHTRKIMEDVHFWATKFYVNETMDIDEYLRRTAEGNFNINPTAYLRYYELLHGIAIGENTVLFDGPIVYEWLLNTDVGREQYFNFFKKGKKCIGVMKNINSSPRLAVYAKALKTGELYVVETLEDHLMFQKKQRGEEHRKSAQAVSDLERKILRGVFKPAKKPFGFEVHIDHLEEMLRIMSADCQMNHVGHEIPYLLNRVDEEIRHQFSQKVMANSVSSSLAKDSEDLFFEEENERDFR